MITDDQGTLNENISQCSYFAPGKSNWVAEKAFRSKRIASRTSSVFMEPPLRFKVKACCIQTSELNTEKVLTNLHNVFFVLIIKEILLIKQAVIRHIAIVQYRIYTDLISAKLRLGHKIVYCQQFSSMKP